MDFFLDDSLTIRMVASMIVSAVAVGLFLLVTPAGDDDDDQTPGGGMLIPATAAI